MKKPELLIKDIQDFSKKDQSRLVANISNVTFDFSNNFLKFYRLICVSLQAINL